MSNPAQDDIDFDYTKYGFRDEENYAYKSEKGLNEDVVRTLSKMKGEPEWMLKRRLKALEIFNKKPLPVTGMWANPKLADLDFQDIFYYVRPGEKVEKSWDDVPENIKNTFEKLGIPEAEQKFLAGVGAQYESEVVYHSLREEWEKLGVIFLDTDTALKEYPEMFQEYFGTVIPSADNKFAALNTAVWSGGSFVYVPKGVKVDIPLQAYFRINAENMGQFERTLIIIDEGAEATYIEGCFTAGARVQTRDGEKPIEDIKIGDEVLTHKGRYRKVYNNLHRLYEGTIYSIRYAGASDRVLNVTREHPFMVLRPSANAVETRTFQPEWMHASMLQVGDYLAIPVGGREGVVLPEPVLSSTYEAEGGTQREAAFLRDERFVYVPVCAISTTEAEVEVFNFAVTEDESYVCEGVVSHNCTAPVYTTNSLHSAVVEIIVKKGGKCRYTTIQNWSNNIYNLVTKRAVAYEEAEMEWIDGNLGCLAQGATVTTPQGVKTIESLEPGEEVLSYDDTSGQLVFRKVLAKRFSGYQPIHTVAVGERKLQVTANHPFYSYTYDPEAAKKLGRYNLAYVRADHLSEAIVPRTSIDYGTPYELYKPWLVTEFNSLNQYADNLTMSRTRQSRLAEIETTTDDIMWLFGYWMGDGNIEIKEAKTEGVVRFAKVGFSTPPTDRARGRLMETMASLIESQPTERADRVHLNWNSKELAELFKLNGFEGKAIDKRVPQWVWSLPESQRLAFIAGYLDADGAVVEAHRRFSLKSANKLLLEDVASLLVTLGITPRLYTEFSEPRTVKILHYECTAHGSYRLSFRLDERLLKHVTAQLSEKAEHCKPDFKERHLTGMNSVLKVPETIEVLKVTVSDASAEPMPTWDIEVEGTGNFISQGFIVHNSRLTMKYPAVYMLGRGAKGQVLSVAYAGEGQHQDAGAKMVHAAPDTTSRITNKSVSKNGGRTTYRGLAKVMPGAHNAKVNVVCDALILDDRSASDTIPYIEIEEDTATVAHEATVGKIGEEQLFYLMSRGLDEAEALSMIVLGFMEPFTRELPMEYAVELNRLIQMEMEGSVG